MENPLGLKVNEQHLHSFGELKSCLVRSHRVWPAHRRREPFTDIHPVMMKHWEQFVLQYFAEGLFSVVAVSRFF